MQVHKKNFLLVYFFLLISHVYAVESTGGLLFTSSKEKVDKRTSLVIFGDKMQQFENSFSISFDLSIWDSSLFGHIFRVTNKQRQQVEFVFVNFYGVDNMYLDFHSPITHESVKIPITQHEIDNKELLHFHIHFDFEEDKALISLKDSVYICSPVGLQNPSQLQFAFGLHGLNLDVPQMLIKNIRIKKQKGKEFFFPLKEPAGNLAHDVVSKQKAVVKNPEWVINKHFHWEKKANYSVTGSACVAYDELHKRILVVNADTVIGYYPRYEKTLFSPHTVNGLVLGDAIYDPVSQLCYVFNSHRHSESLMPHNDIRFEYLPDSAEHFLLHNNIFLSSDGDLYQFGGYGNHTYSQKISRYNRDAGRMEVIDFKGDQITPRLYSAVGDGVHPDEKLLFGGFGNETGRQEHGGHNLYDLHVLNLKSNTISRLWRLQKPPKTEFIPGNNLILSSDKQYFYALCYAHHLPLTAGLLYRFKLEDGSYEVMSDSIHFTSEGMNTAVNLFYNKQIGEYYAVIREYIEATNQHHIQIHSLYAPPVTEAYLISALPRKLPLLWILLVVFSVGLIGGGLYVVWWLKKRKEDKMNSILMDSTQLSLDELTTGHIERKSAIYVFGNFTVFDNKGRDISYRFSQKIRALFTLVLLNSDGDSGISTESLTMVLWPDKDVKSAKNIRGVTINRLRNILEDLDGITLIHQNHQWFFVYESSFYCDYLEYTSVLASIHQSPVKESYLSAMDQLVNIVKNGAFLLSVQDPGVDSYKSKEEEKLAMLLNDYIVYLNSDKQYVKIISLASAYFTIDPLNEEVLKICLRSFHKLGKKDEAKVFLKAYKRTHKLMTGEDFKEGVLTFGSD